MPYIGNPIYQSAFVTDTFSGNGTTTAFTMAVAPAGTTNVLVVVSGVVQDPSTYGVVGNTITFSQAPPTGTNNISCRYLGVPVTGVTTTAYRTVTEFTATTSQTTFTPPSYNVGFINVYLNGVLLGSADYTASNGTTVVLATGASAGNLVTVESFQVSSVLNAIANAVGSVSNSNLATNSVTTTKIADANVTAAKMAASSVVLSSSVVTGVLPYASLPTGSVVQVATGSTSTAVSNSTSTYIDTGITATITPRFLNSTILVFISIMGLYKSSANSLNRIGIQLQRNGSVINQSLANLWTQSTVEARQSSVYNYTDAPASTSALTYKLQFCNEQNVADVRFQKDSNSGTSSIILMEVAG